MAIKLINNCQSKAHQNLPKLGVFGLKKILSGNPVSHLSARPVSVQSETKKYFANIFCMGAQQTPTYLGPMLIFLILIFLYVNINIFNINIFNFCMGAQQTPTYLQHGIRKKQYIVSMYLWICDLFLLITSLKNLCDPLAGGL
jgi:hypothetical protein